MLWNSSKKCKLLTQPFIWGERASVLDVFRPKWKTLILGVFQILRLFNGRIHTCLRVHSWLWLTLKAWGMLEDGASRELKLRSGVSVLVCGVCPDSGKEQVAIASFWAEKLCSRGYWGWWNHWQRHWIEKRLNPGRQASGIRYCGVSRGSRRQNSGGGPRHGKERTESHGETLGRCYSLSDTWFHRLLSSQALMLPVKSGFLSESPWIPVPARQLGFSTQYLEPLLLPQPLCALPVCT